MGKCLPAVVSLIKLEAAAPLFLEFLEVARQPPLCSSASQAPAFPQPTQVSALRLPLPGIISSGHWQAQPLTSLRSLSNVTFYLRLSLTTQFKNPTLAVPVH